MKKAGIILSLIAVSWLILPCQGHCLITTKAKPVEHSCCDSENTTPGKNIPSNHSGKDVQEICKSTYAGYIVPLKYQVEHSQTIVSKIFSDVSNLVQSENYNQSQILKINHSPPVLVESQIQISTLYTPHAPPAYCF